MANKTIYVRQSAEPLWDKAKVAADGSGGISEVVMLLLAEWLERQPIHCGNYTGTAAFCPSCGEKVDKRK